VENDPITRVDSPQLGHSSLSQANITESFQLSSYPRLILFMISAEVHRG